MSVEWKPIESAPKDGTRILIAYYDRTIPKKELNQGFARYYSDAWSNRPYPYWNIEGSRPPYCRNQVVVAWADVPTLPAYTVVEDTIVLENI